MRIIRLINPYDIRWTLEAPADWLINAFDDVKLIGNSLKTSENHGGVFFLTFFCFLVHVIMGPHMWVG